MDFDKPKVYSDTSITDGLVSDEGVCKHAGCRPKIEYAGTSSLVLFGLVQCSLVKSSLYLLNLNMNVSPTSGNVFN